MCHLDLANHGSNLSYPRRQKFALAVMRGFNNIINEAVHLEGDVNAGTPQADLKRDDALLCIHWYAVAIGYLSCL